MLSTKSLIFLHELVCHYIVIKGKGQNLLKMKLSSQGQGKDKRLLELVGSMRHFCIFLKFLFKGLFHPACLARTISWFAFVVAIFMSHENGDNKGQLKGDTCKA